MARHLSFTRAAAELCVTQGAVSQRIKMLELELDVALFDRRAPGLILTATGRRLAETVRAGLDQIASAVAHLTDDGAKPLVVSVLPSFASRWLIPRLGQFTDRHPGTCVQILAENRLADLKDANIHAALRFGLGQHPGISATLLMRDSIVPVCSPALLARIGPVDMAALSRLPVLHDSSPEGDGSGTDWSSWLQAVGAGNIRLSAGHRFSQADLMLDAAVSGLGIGLARISLAGDDIAAGKLTQLAMPAVPTAYAYHLLCRPEVAGDIRLAQFRSWLLLEIEAVGRMLGPVGS